MQGRGIRIPGTILKAFLTACGGPDKPDELAIAFDLDPKALESSDAVLVAPNVHIWLHMVRRTRDPLIGLHGGQRFDLATLEPLLRFVRACPDLRTVFEAVRRYIHMVHSHAKLLVHVRSGVAVAEWTMGWVTCKEESMFFATLSHRVLKQLLPDFSYDVLAIPSISEIERRALSQFFDCEVVGQGNRTRAHFAESWLSKPLSTRLASGTIDPPIDQPEEVDPIADIYRAALLTGACALSDVATKAGMSAYGWERVLDGRATNHSEQLDQARKHVAMNRLRESDETIEVVGRLLGYSSRANFARAFRRWTGTSPAAFRVANRRQPEARMIWVKRNRP